MGGAAAMTLLQTELDRLRSAQRQAPAATGSEDVIHTMIDASAAGDNQIIAAGQALDILEIFIRNASAAQTIILQDGTIPLFKLTDAAPGVGILLGYAGNGKEHFKVSAGNPLVLNLSAGAQVDGFVNYRIKP